MKRLKQFKKTRDNNRSRYHFQDLVEAYSKYDIFEEVVEVEFDMENGGRPVEKAKRKPIAGALVSKEEKIAYDNGGYHTENQIKLYSYDKIEEKGRIIALVDGEEKRYTVHIAADYSRFDTYKDGLRVYRLESDSL